MAGAVMKKNAENSFLIPRKGGMRVDVQVFSSEAEAADASSLEHLRNASKLPSAVRVIGLPNLISENGFVSGCVVGTESALVPGIVGEDPNAGIRLISTPLKAEDVRPRQIVEAVRKAVPLGKKGANVKVHEGDFRLLLEFGIAGLQDVTNKSGSFWEARIEAEEERDARKTEGDGSVLSNSSSVSHHAIERGQNELGTMGDTGHFIDIQIVEGIFDEKAGERLGLFKGQLVVTFSAGSRDFGHQVTEEYMKLARRLNGERAPERGLSFLDAESSEAGSYIHALGCAANFPFVNRQIITALIRDAVCRVVGRKAIPLICDAPYNTLRHETHRQREIWVHRRGATTVLPLDEVELREPGALVIISGPPMGASYILRAGEKCDSTLNSLSVSAGCAPAGEKGSNSKQRASNRSNVDQVVRCLVDTGLAKILARLKSLATTRS